MPVLLHYFQPSKIIELINKICNKQNKDNFIHNDDLITYLEMIKKNLTHQDYDSASILDSIYKIKALPRSGWVKLGVTNPETISSHMYGTMLIATMYLPYENIYDNRVNHNKKVYSKKNIIDILLIHDIGEAFVGDKLPEDNTYMHKILENQAIKYIFIHDTYEDIQDLSRFKLLWDEFYQQNSLNARIARDIDKIEAIYQFYTYKDVLSWVFYVSKMAGNLVVITTASINLIYTHQDFQSVILLII